LPHGAQNPKSEQARKDFSIGKQGYWIFAPKSLFPVISILTMPFIQTPIPGLIVFEPNVLRDDRGYFFESYNKRIWEEAGVHADFVQDNQARSVRGVLRGLHYQTGDMAQAKLVRVVEGEVLDVVVDIRNGSATYGQWYAIRLSAENKRQMFVPRGFAHGYLVLSETAEFFYKCDNFYSKLHEGGIRYDDPGLAIDWSFDLATVVVSEKDMALPVFGMHLHI
jgi:dTDP-4-dehydrorhamnose 3,5-epimerase